MAQREKLRILQAVYCLGRGGAERLSIDITSQLQQIPDMEVLLISFDKTVNHEYSTEGINYLYCPSAVTLRVGKPAILNLDNYRAVLRNFKPHVIHSHRYLTEVITREEIQPGVRYFTHFHDNIVQLKNATLSTFTNKSRFTNFYEKVRLVKKYKACNNSFIAISEDTEAYCKNVLPHSFSNRIHLLHNSINYHKFKRVDNNRSTDKLRLLNIGSFTPKKNQQLLPDIVKSLLDKGIDTHLTMLGDGPLLQKVKEKAGQMGLENYIHFAGNVDNVEDYLRNANMYVHTATYEPFGLVLLEAMAAGLPVVSLDGHGNRNLIDNGNTGYIFTDPNPELFADHIVKLMSDATLYNKIRSQADVFASKHDIAQYVKQLITLYNNA